jgi:hypothetical protein
VVIPANLRFPRVSLTAGRSGNREVRMTELAQSARQSTKATELPTPGSDYLPQGHKDEPDDQPVRGSAAGETFRLIAWVTGGVCGVLAIAWFILLGPGESEAKALWVFSAVIFVAVLASLWQTHSILRQARWDADESFERLRQALAAAEKRSKREMTLVRSIHEAEMDSQRRLARAELAAQVELARVERVHLLAQQQRLAMDGVSRAVSAHTQALATLWNQGSNILQLKDREAREQAMNPIFEQIGQVVHDFSAELANANLLIDDERLHRALLTVNDAVLAAMHVAEDVHVGIVDGHAPEPNPIPGAQRLLRERAAEARHLAWNLLRTSLDDTTTTDGRD